MSPSATQRTHSIATMGADGIGPEVINAGVQVLKKLAQLDGTFKLRFTDYDWSSETYKKTGQYIPDGGLEQLKKHDAILFGAVGAPGTAHIKKCDCDVYANRDQMYRTISPYGAYGLLYAKPSTSMQTSVLQRSSEVLRRRYGMQSMATWTGSSFAKTQKVNTLDKVGALIKVSPGRQLPNFPFSLVMVSNV